MEPTRIGIVGCGNISGVYFENLTKYRATTVVACADLDLDRARATAEKRGVPLALAPDALLEHPDVEVVVNLTVPQAHASVARQAVANGKHVYGEKPFTVEREDGRALLREAAEKGVRVGGAPDTFLGAGHQTARAALDRGDIGEVVGVQGFMLCAGHESWHPSPEFYYLRGGGPMLDMGPYYLTAFANLLGPAARVAGTSRITRKERTITSQPKAGTVMPVETPTHIAGVLDYANGAVGELTTSFDVWASPGFPPILVHGTEGTMLVPDPNGFGGEVKVFSPKTREWSVVEIQPPYAAHERGLGVLDMVAALHENRPHRASGELAYHVLDLMWAFIESGEAEHYYRPETAPPRPAALGPEDLAEYA